MKLESNIQSHYFPDPGVVQEPVQCGVCGETMDVKRDVDGPTNYTMAICGSKRPHDSFSCPFYDTDWHNQVVALRNEARSTASARLHDMLEKEADEIVSTRKATK